MSQEDKAAKKIKPAGNRSDGWNRKNMTKTHRKGKKKAKTIATSAQRNLSKAVVKVALESIPPQPLLPVSEGLVPIDYERCQAEVSNGVNFMTLGGRRGMVRCESPARWAAHDKKPRADGKVGHMSLCQSCLFHMEQQEDMTSISVIPIDLYQAQMMWDALDGKTRKIFEDHGLKRPVT